MKSAVVTKKPFTSKNKTNKTKEAAAAKAAAEKAVAKKAVAVKAAAGVTAAPRLERTHHIYDCQCFRCRWLVAGEVADEAATAKAKHAK